MLPGSWSERHLSAVWCRPAGFLAGRRSVSPRSGRTAPRRKGLLPVTEPQGAYGQADREGPRHGPPWACRYPVPEGTPPVSGAHAPSRARGRLVDEGGRLCRRPRPGDHREHGRRHGVHGNRCSRERGSPGARAPSADSRVSAREHPATNTRPPRATLRSGSTRRQSQFGSAGGRASTQLRVSRPLSAARISADGPEDASWKMVRVWSPSGSSSRSHDW